MEETFCDKLDALSGIRLKIAIINESESLVTTALQSLNETVDECLEIKNEKHFIPMFVLFN
jgi:hypothetical protein